MSHWGLNILSAIQGVPAIWDVRYWEVSLYLSMYDLLVDTKYYRVKVIFLGESTTNVTAVKLAIRLTCISLGLGLGLKL